MQPEFEFLAGHALAHLARQLIGHAILYTPPTRRAKARRPPHEGEVRNGKRRRTSPKGEVKRSRAKARRLPYQGKVSRLPSADVGARPGPGDGDLSAASRHGHGRPRP